MKRSMSYREQCRAAFAGLSAFCQVDRELHAQFDAALRDFVGGNEKKLSGPRALRYFEWFALERGMDGHGQPPLAAFVALGCPGLAADLRPWMDSLLEAQVEVALVRDLDQEGLDLRLASDESQRRVYWDQDLLRPGAGDTVLGLLVKVPEQEGYVLTDACAQQPGSRVFELFAGEASEQRLAGRIEEELRPRLLDIDRFLVLQGEREPRALSVLEGELGALVRELADDELRAEDISATLRESREPSAAFGPLLDRFAFETELDLDPIRELLLELWARVQIEVMEEGSEQGQAPPQRRVRGEELDGAELLAKIEAAEARGERMLDVLDQIEEELGIAEPEAQEELIPERVDWATEELGSLDALVQEFQWERQQKGMPLSEVELQTLQSFVQHAASAGIREPERISGKHVASFLIRSWQLAGISACLEALARIGRFETWLEDVHSLSFEPDAGELRVALAADEKRMRELETGLGEGASDGAAPLGWHVRERASTGEWILAHAQRELRLEGALPLAVGDLLLGMLREGAAGFAEGVRILPKSLAAYLESAEDEREDE
ncbi:MAG: hypothetical protein CSA62_12220 [Planctomycetota bacterium]|nr:MAG: hypothetical protein CSA62_12220 [Planctomycetota bacterium]